MKDPPSRSSPFHGFWTRLLAYTMVFKNIQVENSREETFIFPLGLVGSCIKGVCSQLKGSIKVSFFVSFPTVSEAILGNITP